MWTFLNVVAYSVTLGTQMNCRPLSRPRPLAMHSLHRSSFYNSNYTNDEYDFDEDNENDIDDDREQDLDESDEGKIFQNYS